MNESVSQSQGLASLTNSQSLVWTSQRLAPTSPLFNMAHRFDIATDIDPERFRLALNALTAASDALRTVFIESGNAVRQQVLETLQVPLCVVDLSADADPEASAGQWIQARAQQALDLSACCHDSALLKVAPGHWLWFFNIHHLISDAWSIALICRHLGHCYMQLAQGAAATVDPLPAFLDYRHHEHDWRQGQAFREAKHYWRQRAGDRSGLIALYGNKGSRSQSRSARLSFDLGRDRSERINALAQEKPFRSLSPHLSRFNLLATAIFAYLYRVGQNQQMTIGTPAHNRPSLAFRETIGLFIDTLPFSVSVEDGESFRSLFSKVSRESQYFLKYAQAGCSDAELSRTFNVLFNYINTAFGDFAGTPMRSTLVHSDAIDSGHDLRIQVHDVDDRGQYRVHLDCNVGTYAAALRERMPGHILAVLDGFLQDPDTPIDTVCLTDDAEQRAAVSDLNDHYVGPAQTTVLQAFSRQVSEQPDCTAARATGGELSYAQLEQRSSQLAQQLMRQGLRNGDVVGLHMRRSPELLTAVLAVLKAGGVFVPLESRLPDERLAFIVHDANMAMLLSDAPPREGAGVSAVPWLNVTAALGEASHRAVAPLPLPAAGQTAYILYTSGSTGRPKGVVVTHGALAAYVHWAHAAFARGERCDFPLYSSIGFDLTITSLFVPLVSGASVVIYPENERGPDLAVLEVFADDDVDVVKLTPAHLALVLEQARPLQRIRSLVLGGENLSTDLAAQALQALGEIEIFNEYGPTEAVVGCMRHRYDPRADTGVSVPIGVPAEHHRIYLLDPGGNPLPRGVSGELYIAGEALASGYLNRDGEQADRFLLDPFVAGQRMYRSGDLGRMNSDGLIEYLGRADEQLKIRGVRVEPAEVERVIAAFPGITDCVVDAVDLGEHRLPAEAELHHCSRCGLSSDYPGVSYDAQGVCNLCQEFERIRDRAQIYFDDMDGLRRLLAKAREKREGPYDCIMLLSGGKDSTYALYRLAEQGPSILALTLDNGFISEGAKDNIRKVVDSIGVDHRFLATPAMNEIFRDSLERHSNVCQGCFKTIYTLALQTAVDEGIPYIVTGLSRGQFFETRLTPELFEDDDIDLITIERTVLEARRAYHGIDDAIARCLDVSMFDNDRVFEKVGFIDFYRYCDVSLEEVYRFLGEKAPWIRPQDTGRSTNCLINDAGIYVHRRKEGFHNYALPYSWDVRMGHKTREAALEELDDQLDVVRVHRMLDEIGYTEEILHPGATGQRLVAYFTGDSDVDETALRNHCARYLPDAMVPGMTVAMQEFPLTANGKIDRRALPVPEIGRPQLKNVYIAPQGELEQKLAAVWREVLGVSRLGRADNYYALGGDSIAAIQIAVRAQETGLRLAAIDIFEHQTIEALARHLEHAPGDGAAQGDTGSEAEAPEAFSLAALDQEKLRKVAAMLSRKGK